MELTLGQALQKGVAAHKAGMIQEADRYYTSILKIHPRHSDANHNMGVLAVDIGKVHEALPFFKTALETNPKVVQYWLSYLEALIKLGRLTDAKEVLDQAKRADLQMDEFDKCKELFSNLSDEYIEMQDPPAEQLQALINLHTHGRYSQVINEASRLLKKFPYSISLYNISGAASQGLGNLEDAIEGYKKALSIKPNFAEALNNMGIALRSQGKIEEGIEAYKKALSIKPDYFDAYYNLGIAFKDEGKLEEAVGAFSKTLELKPDHAEAYDNMGNALKDQGKLAEAIKAYKKALSIKPEYGNAKHMLSALTGNTYKKAPREYVENLFDRYSKKFESALVDDLEYKIPKVIRNILITPHNCKSLGSVLDLGCGTGLLGPEIRNYCSRLEGIDLSSNIIMLANQNKVYDKLTHSDIVEYLSSMPLEFDYYIALDVFIYVGDLTEIFQLIKSRNNKSCNLVFSTEHTDVNGYHLLQTGRYSHSKTYIESLCEKFDYNISHFSTNNLRKDKGKFLIGGLYVISSNPK